MRHQYTPIFSEVLTSRIWAMAPSARAVWLWFMLKADPEGFVCASTAGVAIGANVTLEAAIGAIAELTLPDPDDELPVILEKVPRGWRIVGFEEGREQAKTEARLARMRRYMRARRAVANDSLPGDTDSPSSPSVSPPKRKPKTKPTPPAEEIPPAPQLEVIEPEYTLPDELSPGIPSRVVAPRVHHTFPASWLPSEALRDDARIAGVTDFDERLASLRTGPIGGTRGVLEDKLDDYVRSFFGKWRTWASTDRYKAMQAQPAMPKPERIQGYPAWVSKEQLTLAKAKGWNLKKLAKEFALGHHIPPNNLDVSVAALAFSQFLERHDNPEAA